MHEASLIDSLMRRIDEVARAEGARRVVSVAVWLGALTHMSAGHFIEHFGHAAAGTIAEGAALNVDVSSDMSHARAQEIVLQSVEVET
ncbi:MAG: hydrogenase/urease maturation nickel metallochaperone HypA [Alphaproteobacteria bacterium]